MLKIGADLTSYALSAGEPWLMQVQLLAPNSAGTDIADDALVLSFYAPNTGEVVETIEGVRDEDGSGEFFRFERDGVFSSEMYGEFVRVELSRRFLNGKQVLGDGALSVVRSAVGVPSLAGQPIGLVSARVTIKAAELLGAAPTISVTSRLFVPIAQPVAPSFTAAPSILTDGTPQVGEELTGVDGEVENGTVVSRRWMLNGILVSAAQSYIPIAAGELMFDNTAQGPGGKSVATSSAVQVVAAGVIPSTALAFSAPLRRGSAAPNALTLLNRALGSTFTTSIPGLSIDNLTGGVTGTAGALSGLITETFADGTSKDTLMFMPKAGPRKMRLGMNLGPIAYYQRQVAFLDYMKEADWQIPPATADANGMPLTLNDYFGYQCVANVGCEPGTPSAPVRYRLIMDGSLVPDGWTKQGDDYILDYVGDGGRMDLKLRSASATIATPPTHIRVVREDQKALLAAGEVFQPAFAAELGKFAWLRVMNWHGGNFTDPQVDNPNSLFFSATEAPRGGVSKGVPLSIIAALVRKTGKGLWYNVHHKITKAQFLADIKPTLDALVAEGHEVYVEYSNETWNGTFPQHQWCIQAANDAGYVGGYSYASSWWTGRWTADVAQACRGSGLRFVVGVQTGEPATYLTDVLFQGMNTIGGWQSSDLFGWHVSGYQSGTITQNPGDPQGPLQDQWIGERNFARLWDNVLNFPGTWGTPTGLSGETERKSLKNGKATADAHGLKLMVYEGDDHLNRVPAARSDAYGPVLYAMADTQLRARALYTLYERSEEEGVYGYTHFDFNHAPANGNDGVFGIYGRPAYQGALDFLAATDDSGASVVYVPPVLPTASYSRIKVSPTRVAFNDFTPSDTYYRAGIGEIRAFVGNTEVDLKGWTATSASNYGGNPVTRVNDGDAASGALTEQSNGNPANSGELVLRAPAGSTGYPFTRILIGACPQADIYNLKDCAVTLSKNGEDYVGGGSATDMVYVDGYAAIALVAP